MWSGSVTRHIFKLDSQNLYMLLWPHEQEVHYHSVEKKKQQHQCDFSAQFTTRWHVITVFYHFTNICWFDVFGLHDTTTTDMSCFRSSFSSFPIPWSHLLHIWCMILINNMKNGWLNDATFYVDNIVAHLIGRHTRQIVIYLPNFVTIRNVVSSQWELLTKFYWIPIVCSLNLTNVMHINTVLDVWLHSILRIIC